LPCPEKNVKHHIQPVATDIVVSDTPAADSGSATAQLFVAQHSLVDDTNEPKKDK
jgi:hypothetical protein